MAGHHEIEAAVAAAIGRERRIWRTQLALLALGLLLVQATFHPGLARGPGDQGSVSEGEDAAIPPRSCMPGSCSARGGSRAARAGFLADPPEHPCPRRAVSAEDSHGRRLLGKGAAVFPSAILRPLPCTFPADWFCRVFAYNATTKVGQRRQRGGGPASPWPPPRRRRW